MSNRERIKWAKLANVIQQASAAATALGCGFISNHGDSLGDPAQAMARVRMRLTQAISLLTQTPPDDTDARREAFPQRVGPTMSMAGQEGNQ